MAIRYATDANDQLIYTLDEASAPWANSGAAGSLNLNVQAAGPVSAVALFSNGISYPGGNATSKYLTSGAAGTSVGEPSSNVTLSAFIKPTSFGAFNQSIVCKAYRPDASGWTSPFASIHLYIPNNSNPALTGSIVVGAAQKTVSANNVLRAAGNWNHIGLTFDSVTLRLYVNGVQVATLAQTGSIDYGTHGPWTIGGEVSANDTFTGLIEEVRFANVVRAQSWFSEVSANGLSVNQKGSAADGVDLSSSAKPSGKVGMDELPPNQLASGAYNHRRKPARDDLGTDPFTGLTGLNTGIDL